MAATKLSSCFVNHGWITGGTHSKRSDNVRFVDFSFIPRRPHHHHRLSSPASCKMRYRSFSAQHKRQQVKKTSPKQPQIDAKLQPNGEESVEIENTSLNWDSSSSQEIIPKGDEAGITVSNMVNQNGLDELSKLDDNNTIMFPPKRLSNSTVSRLDSSNMPFNNDVNSNSKSL